MARRFRYGLDPVCLTAFALYLANRFVFELLEGPRGGFCQSYANDLLCIPFLLPLCLRVYRLLGLRDHDGAPTFAELLIHLVVWSLFFEVIAPRLGGPFAWTVADPWDIAAYAAGALAAGIYWRAPFRIRRLRTREASA